MAALRQKDEADRDITIAWYVAMLSRQEKVPPLKALLQPAVQRAKTQTLAEQRAMVGYLSEYYRIPLREVKH